ncbi:MAG: hypothetical protein AB7F76_16455 [Parvibaculaceae bacterium]
MSRNFPGPDVIQHILKTSFELFTKMASIGVILQSNIGVIVPDEQGIRRLAISHPFFLAHFGHEGDKPLMLQFHVEFRVLLLDRFVQETANALQHGNVDSNHVGQPQ